MPAVESKYVDIIVTYLMEQIRQLPRESVDDFVTLLKTLNQPETSTEEQEEILETMREILYPESLGKIHFGRPESVTNTPENLHKRSRHVGNTIKKYRSQKGMTQAALAKRSDLPQSHISRLEQGTHSPSMKTLEKIAKALKIQVGNLDPSCD